MGALVVFSPGVIPVVVMLLAILGWLLSVAATAWYLRTVHQMHQEMQAIRRYLQAISAKLDRR